ncbi:TolC family outer membrane protein [Thiolinea disciformis]|uniref:TolC family outer membrane protein n=1 Tax=Thiolinea disciformis TaxID=125614 RepID=UPI00035FAA4D|nr:TolC family outer membrane protein [Thiolinea disciformis]
MKMKPLVSCVAATWALLSSPAYSENLLQVYQQAKNYDAQLKAQETNYLAILESKPQALAAKKPQVSLNAGANFSQQHTFYDGTITGGSANSSALNANYTLNISKSVYNKALDARIDKVDSSLAQAKLQLESQRQALIMRVVQPYFDYLLAKETLQVASTEKNAIKKQLDQVKAFFEAGRSAVTDVREAESRYNLAVAREVSGRQALDVARESLRVLTGISYKDLLGAQPNIGLSVPAPKSMEAWVELAKRSSKPLQVARQAIEVAQKEIDIQRQSERNPVVNIYARHTGSWYESNGSVLDPRALGATVGVEVNVPIYEGGAAPSRIRQAQHEFRQAQQNYDYQERLIEQQVRSAYLGIESAISVVQAQQKALASAETAAAATKVGFEVGTRTAVDVLTALRDVFAARRDYANARYNFLLSTLQLRQAAGTLSENDLRILSASLNKR